MSTRIGRFEILSELSKSATGAVYKANDPQTSQTVALKAIQLSAFGEDAEALKKWLSHEAETTKVLNNPNLAQIYAADEIDGQFCAAMEYIQGNSIATMLARKEGFSIWDLLDIGRQGCEGLDHAHSQKIFHYSLEPAKVMCGWDSSVKILGFGISSVGKFTAQMPEVPSLLSYMSPEQVRDEDIDARSNIFSLGAIFYEMVTDRKAFDGHDFESLRQSVLESTPLVPAEVNPKIHPLLSDLIMKALAKDPEERYQSAGELLYDLEKCKESKAQATTAPAPTPVKAIGAAPVNTVSPTNPTLARLKSEENKPTIPRGSVSQTSSGRPSAPPSPRVKQESARKAAAAAAAGGATAGTISVPTQRTAPRPNAASSIPPASMSSAVCDETVGEAPAKQRPGIAVDPIMSEGAPSRGGVRFSEMTDLPPLKEVQFAPPPPPASEHPLSLAQNLYANSEPEKPKIQPREVAGKAIKEIKNVPPRLMVYSIAGAVVLILIIAAALVLHINHLNSDDDSAHPVAAESSRQPAEGRIAAPVQSLQLPGQTQASTSAEETQPQTTRALAAARGRKAKKKPAAPVVPFVIPGQMAIDSNPQGAQVQLDGKNDASWVTPFTLSGLDPGQHTVTVTKAGYSPDTRVVEVASGSKAFVVTHLSQLMATLSVTSMPPGANVYVDGMDTGKTTPAQVSVDKGQHVVLVRKAGFIDETTSAQFVLAQTVSFSPTLRALGNVEDIKTLGRMSKLFGNKAAQGMGTFSIKTQPKGAQIAVNQHMLDKTSPVEILLDPGNYVVDITLTGYSPVHKVITVEKGAKAVIDVVMQHE
ncbi:MAG: PEGA domain-containing protein [Candidatus Sulfotelmatobacter sp.]